MSAWLLLLMLGSARAGEEWGPWDGAWAPVGEVQALPARTAAPTGFFERAYRWYRRRSEHNGGGCPYYPTCSAYGVLAVREHGPLVGGLLTVDRLFREYPFMDHAHDYPLVTPHGIPRLYDPVPPARQRRSRRGDGGGD